MYSSTLGGMAPSTIPTVEELAGMTSGQYKIAENLARRMAERQGLKLEKSRRRDPRALDYGRLSLIDIKTNAVRAESDPGTPAAALAHVFKVLVGDA
jgi:hypothetical protein